MTPEQEKEADRRGQLVAKVDALIETHGLAEVLFALRVNADDRGLEVLADFLAKYELPAGVR